MVTLTAPALPATTRRSAMALEFSPILRGVSAQAGVARVRRQALGPDSRVAHMLDSPVA